MAFPRRATICSPRRPSPRQPTHGGFRAGFAAASIAALVIAAACDDPVPPPPTPASITLSPTSVRFTAVGETARLTAVVKDEAGAAISGQAIDWTVDDTLVATVDETGLVRAEGSGVTRITATAGLVSATVPVTVEGDRQAMEALYRATGGDDWIEKQGWLSDDPLGDWFGVETDANGRVVELDLYYNDLDGSLPPEIGSLTRLQILDLGGNYLLGSLPSELGGLTELHHLFLDSNLFSGAIPAEIGDLGELRLLDLSYNDLDGPIPAEIGNLANLETLLLQENGLTGPIPAQLGGLPYLTRLAAHDNALSGEIPGELGNLAQLTRLWLGGNGLTGPLPVALTGLATLEELMLEGLPLAGALPDEIGGMSGLESLILTNSGLAGTLPGSMTGLGNLRELMLGGTKLCAPDDDGFRTWLAGVVKRRVPSCATPEGGSAAYLTQAVQSWEYPVPLVAGEEALLRVFAVAPAAAGDTIPLVRATFHLNGGVAKVVEIEPGSSLIGGDVNEGSLDASANALIEASLIQPGLEMVVEIDPEGTIDPELGVGRRLPETGRIAVDVRRMPDLDLTLVPFLWEEDPDSAILEITGDMSADDNLLWSVNNLLPVGDIDLKIHDAVVSSSNDAFSLIGQTEAIRAAEGGAGYYLGSMSGTTEGALGIAQSPGWVSFSILDSAVIGHEVGHNMSLAHAPCGGAGGPDPSFPQPDGTIGAWGYDIGSEMLVPPSTPDIMGYCDPVWMSEFFFTQALRHRLLAESETLAAHASVPTRSILIWGGLDPDGIPFLQPAFVIDAAPSPPSSRGPHRLEGTTANGARLFAFDFGMPAIADADGAGSFAFALPVAPEWGDSLARITLSGPGGSVTLDARSDRPAAMVRDPRNGRVRGILTDMSPGTRAADLLLDRGFEPGLELVFSRGIPDAAAWRR